MVTEGIKTLELEARDHDATPTASQESIVQPHTQPPAVPGARLRSHGTTPPASWYSNVAASDRGAATVHVMESGARALNLIRTLQYRSLDHMQIIPLNDIR